MASLVLSFADLAPAINSGSLLCVYAAPPNVSVRTRNMFRYHWLIYVGPSGHPIHWTHVDISAEYIAKFGPWRPGARIWVAARLVNYKGLSSARASASTFSL
jgi:hypothetical protein